jgi:hypothetical protein
LSLQTRLALPCLALNCLALPCLALPCLALPWVNQQLHWYHGKTRGVSHCSLAIYIKKYLKAKEELWKLKYFTIQKLYNLQNIL